MSDMTTLRQTQLGMARYLREPLANPAPEGVEPRRLAVYRELVYNATEGFLSAGFPVLRSLYNDADWAQLVRRFIAGHRCSTPYFLEISREFIAFVSDDYLPSPCDPPFLAELAHYEWVELALDIAEGSPPPPPTDMDPLAAVPYMSEVAWLLSYAFPVHRIGPGFRPDSAAEPTFLVVYRGRDENIGFMALNAATARLLELVREGSGETGERLLAQLAAELQAEPAAIRGFAAEQLNQFVVKGVIGLRTGGIAT